MRARIVVSMGFCFRINALAGFVNDFGLNRSGTTYEQVTLWVVLLDYQCTSL